MRLSRTISFLAVVVIGGLELFLNLIRKFTFIFVQICRLGYSGDASSSSDAFSPPASADAQDTLISQWLPSPANAIDSHLAPPDSPMASELVNTGNTESLSPNGRDQATPEISGLLQYVGMILLERYFMERKGADLAVSIDVFQVAEGLRPLNHPHRPSTLNGLAVAFCLRYKRGGRESDLSNAIDRHQEALNLRHPGEHDRSSSMTDLEYEICTWSELLRRNFGLSDSIKLNQDVLNVEPPWLPHRVDAFLERENEQTGPTESSLSAAQHQRAREEAIQMNDAAVSLLKRYQQEGGPADLINAIQLFRRALPFIPANHPDRSASLSNLAAALLTRYKRDGGDQDLEEAIQLDREALSLSPPGHPDRSMSLNNLATAVQARYEWKGRGQDLENAIQLHREALALRPPGHPDRPNSLNNLAGAVHTRYKRDGGEQDLEEAILLDRAALPLFPPGHPARSTLLGNLANAVQTRYERDGGEQDLSDAIQLAREALSISPPGHPNRLISLDLLATGIQTRCNRDGGVEDLEEAIQLGREALSLSPPGHLNRSSSFDSLAAAVEALYGWGGGKQYLEEAIELNREALSLRPPGHPDRPMSLNNLANAVYARYGPSEVVQDLSEAIQLYREVLSLSPPGHPIRSTTLNNLASAIQTRYERDGGEYDLEEAIQLNREAVFLFPPGHPARSASLINLANAVQTRYMRAGEEQDLKETVQLLVDATAVRTSPIPDRLRAAFQWVDIAIKHNLDSALDAYRSAFTLMHSVLALGWSLQDRHINLLSHRTRSRSTKGLALDAALWALSSTPTDPKLAVELLDQGRNVLLASIGQFRADLSDVRRNDPALADDFYRLSRVLDSAILSGQEISVVKSTHEDARSRYKRVSAQWEDVIAKIRLLPGCESFLLPMPYTQLQEAAVGGPVIVILVGKERSTAIIVLPKGEPHTINLPQASEEALRTLHQEMDYVLEISSRAIRGMGRILLDLWNILVQPIIQELQNVLRIPNGSRIWWYPTSWASFLPLHAAGSYRQGGSNVPNLYTSSYTPTLQALRRSRGRLSSSSDRTPRCLIVSQAHTPGQIALPNVDYEVGIVFSLIPDASLLADDKGTREDVLHGLRSHSWIHLTCHGHSDPSDPFQSHFILHDGPLSLQDIITNDLPSADFAFLSTCHSAAQDRTLPDEGLALAGGMQFAGFKSVVGTLWAMADVDAPPLAEEFYKGLVAKSGDGEGLDCTKAAESLQHAARELRKQKVPLYRWINLVHYGI